MSLWTSIKRSKGGLALVTVGTIVTFAFTPVIYYMNFAPKVTARHSGS